MICEKCSSLNDDKNEVCFNCGNKLKKSVGDNNASKPAKKMKIKNNLLKKGMLKKLGIITLSVLGIVLIIVMVCNILAGIKDNEGYNYAQKMKASVGVDDIMKMGENGGIYFELESKSAEINALGDAKYIYECEEMIKVDGIKVPKWIIKVDVVSDAIHYLYYRNYSLQEDNYKGVKVKEPISVLKVEIGQNLREVENIFGIKPISIKYFADSTVYLYRYYCINEFGDEQDYCFEVTFDGIDNKKMAVKEYKKYDLEINQFIK